MIPVETQYKSHEYDLLAIVATFETWHQYLESSKYEILDFTNYNNMRRFMDPKNQSSRQVYEALELLKDRFQINYCQRNTHEATDTVLSESQQKPGEKATL